MARLPVLSCYDWTSEIAITRPKDYQELKRPDKHRGAGLRKIADRLAP
jgi:hypothetical protein